MKPPPAPVARVAVVKDTYFGETLSDPYRWMENDKDPDWLPYLKAQNDRTRTVLDALPGRAAMLQRIQRLSGDTVATGRVQRAGGRLFFQQRPLGADNFKLFVRENGQTRVLVDPTTLSGPTSHVSLDWWRASPDGTKVVYGLSKDGSEDSLLHILTVADGRDLPDRIPNTQAADPRWLDDGSGFFYNQLTGKVDTPERFLDSQARFHRIGTDPATDPAGKVADTGITPKPPIDVSRYEAKRFFATAKDGAKIPYSLVYRKGLKLDGTNPTWISAYGSYGAAAYTPSFQARQLALIDAGAIVGYANVRGGGEYGREWHKAGQLENKPNTWRDLIAVCEELCAKKYTSPAHLAIGGRSAGGITVGRALTERPDLFAAVVDGVGWSNPLRYVVEQNGFGEEPEWGAIAEEKGYRALKSIDSYQAVKDGTPYPAVLLTTGVTDPRVAPFHVAKMTARLQAASSSGKPVLLRVDYDAGHGVGSTRAQQDREAADTYVFLLWQLGAKAYQPV